MSLASMDLSIVIPCFNEAKNVSLVLEQLQNLLESSKDSVEVIVIDGGSTDDTPNELKHIFQSLPSSNFKLILKLKNMKYSIKSFIMVSREILWIKIFLKN